MREFINIPVLANLVMMLRADIYGAIWLVNDDDDARFYERCAHAKARVIPAPKVAIDLLQELMNRGLRGVVASVSAPESDPSLPNVFYPSVGDIPSLFLRSENSDAVITEAFGSPWFRACRNEIECLRRRVVWVACVLRVLLEEQEISVPSAINLVDWATLDVKVEPAAGNARVVTRSKLTEAEQIVGTWDFDRQLSNSDGVLSMNLLAAASKQYRPHGLAADREVSASTLLSMLRVSFDLEELEQDRMFWRMRAWERRYPRYPLLGAWRALDPLGVVWDQRYWSVDLASVVSMN